MDRILVVDFGGQYAHLIANRLRRLGFLADITSGAGVTGEIKKGNVKGIIFSGGPSSVYEKNAPTIPDKVFSLDIPILGICYGQQLISYKLDGEVRKGSIKEYGSAVIKIKDSPLFEGLGKEQIVWMSHGDCVSRAPAGFRVIARSEDGIIAGIEDEKKKIYGVQFHPEVVHTANGMKILENFASRICLCKREWNPKNYVNEIADSIKKLAKGKKVFLLVSGGVDSVVLFTLLNKILGKERVFGLHVDTGFMRANESAEVKKALQKLGINNLTIIDASEKFINALKGLVNPEDKRKVIGDLFIEVLDERTEELLSSGKWIVAQGTIYPDTIETKGTQNADLIKTHHNRVLHMQELIAQGKVIEPLSHLYKDEVRELGKIIGLPEYILKRHPFPGPGLAVRILCNDKKAEDVSAVERKLRIIDKSAFVLPIKSVGVQGDCRTYKHPAAVNHWVDWDELEKLSTDITNRVAEVNRALLLLKKKEGKIRLLKKSMTRSRVELLQKADTLFTGLIRKHGLYDKIWQAPVILAPLSVINGESIILRPVDSQEAMTARFSRIPRRTLTEIANKLLQIKGIDAVFYDVTNKPPATIEWE